jgi:hypothetical protein
MSIEIVVDVVTLVTTPVAVSYADGAVALNTVVVHKSEVAIFASSIAFCMEALKFIRI